MGFLCGPAVAACSFVWGGYIVVWRVVTKDPIRGFATLAVGMLFLGGVQLISIGILGEYVGRIHNEVKGRPLYVVDRLVGAGRAERPDGSAQRRTVPAPARRSEP